MKLLTLLSMLAAAALAGCAIGYDQAGNAVFGVKAGTVARTAIAATEAMGPFGIAASIVGGLATIATGFYYGHGKGWDAKAKEPKP